MNPKLKSTYRDVICDFLHEVSQDKSTEFKHSTYYFGLADAEEVLREFGYKEFNRVHNYRMPRIVIHYIRNVPNDIRFIQVIVDPHWLTFKHLDEKSNP